MPTNARLLARLAALAALAASPARGEFTSLNLGMDYRLRGVSVDNNDLDSKTGDHLGYYSHSARFYMTAWLNENVEAALRIQSLNIWGLEGAAGPATRYPSSDGTPWIEDAYIHLPGFAWDRLKLIVGRQPITIGDGMLVSNDNLGYNGFRAQLELPWTLDADLFTAKVREGLAGQSDFDLHGFILGTNREHNRWELALIQEKNGGNNSFYQLGNSSTTSNSVSRRFYDIRLHGSLKDAYYKLEYAMQTGEASLASAGNVKLEGTGQRLELGAQADHIRWGRFGVRVVYATGSGDDNGTPTRDEAFRPTFARRWDGLQRRGYGSHFAATLSDAYDRNNPFSPTATGLPPGFSGIKTQGIGIFSTQKVAWTGELDYFIYEAMTKPTGQRDLGTELDGLLTYRYTGFVTFRLGGAFFFPGNVFGNLASKAERYTLEANVHF